MSLLSGLSVLNNGLVLIYGLFLSVQIAIAEEAGNRRKMTLALCPVLLLVQLLCWLWLGEDVVRKLYPLITHLPLVLFVTFGLKKPLSTSVISVLTAYLCCQLPRWCKLMVIFLSGSTLAGELTYTLCIGPLYLALRQFFVGPAHSSVAESGQTQLLFGSLPAVYYLFDYATTVYSDFLYAGIPALSELTATVLIVFYVLFMTVYHYEAQKRMGAELEATAQQVLLTQAQNEVDALRKMQMQTTIYKHDMRHHLNMLETLLAAKKTEQALDYIRQTQEELLSISVRRFCGNETANLILSAFAEKAAKMGVRLTVCARLPEMLRLSDTELCAVLSNALENALNAAAEVEKGEKWTELYCGVKRDKLLIEVKNPYSGGVIMKDGLPVSGKTGHGFGCHSIRSIVRKHNGLYTFEPNQGIFTLQIVLPLP